MKPLESTGRTLGVRGTLIENRCFSVYKYYNMNEMKPFITCDAIPIHDPYSCKTI